MAENFKKKICLITGARTGIGLSIGITLAKNGYRVIFSGRKLNDCKDTVTQLVTDGFQAFESPFFFEKANRDGLIDLGNC